MKMKSIFAMLLTLLTLVIVGCGDDGPKSTPFATAPAATPAAASNGGTAATSTITATLPVGTPAGTVVNFTITSGNGTLSSATAVTDAAGLASVTLTSTAPGDVVVLVTSAGFASPVTVPFVSNGALTVTANPTTVAINAPTVISAQLPTAAPGETISFTTTGGALSAASAVTDAAGLATVTLTAPATPGTVTVTATAGLVAAGSAVVTVITQPTLAIVKVATTGLPAGTTIGGITAHVIANPATGLSIAATDIATSGAGIGSTLVPNVANLADITLGLINATGMQGGEFATLNYHVAVGTFPAAGDFTIAPGFTVIDTNGVAIAGVSVVIQSVTPQ
jgi:hypothetical protein